MSSESIYAASCEVQDQNLVRAQVKFNKECSGFTRVDCDPAASKQWVCASYNLTPQNIANINNSSNLSMPKFNTNFKLDFANSIPSTLQAGSDLLIEVNSTGSQTPDKIDLFINNTLIRSERIEPFQWNHGAQNDTALQNLKPGQYQLHFKAYAKNQLIESKSRSLAIKPVTPSFKNNFKLDFSKSIPSTLASGDNLIVEVGSTGKQTPDRIDFFLNNRLVRSERIKPFQWNHNSQDDKAMQNLKAGRYQLQYKAYANNQFIESKSRTLVVNKSQKPTSVQTVVSGELVMLNTNTGRWQVQGGAQPIELQANKGLYKFIAPITSSFTEINFKETNTGAQQTVKILPCNQNTGEVYTDCLSAPFGPFKAFETNAKGEDGITAISQKGHVQWRQTSNRQHGKFMEVTWNSNNQAQANGSNGFFQFDIDSTATNFNAYRSGVFEFDLKFTKNTDASIPFNFRLECGPRCRGDDYIIRPSQFGNQWRKVIVPIYNFAASGVNVSKLTAGLFWPQWYQQNHQVSVQIDNMRFRNNFNIPTTNSWTVNNNSKCTGTGEVTFEISTAGEGITDQKIQQMQQGMAEAAAIYNCYTNLKKHIRVTHNSRVPTADAVVGGTNIRFGGSTGTRTALHELGHAFAAGTANWRSWINNGKFMGPRTTALVKLIQKDPNAQLNAKGYHFWPYGMNYNTEDSQQNRIYHVLIVEAMYKDQLAKGPY